MKNWITRLAFAWISRQMKNDPGYAWSWHCNVAMAQYDAVMTMPADFGPHRIANMGARVFMGRAFGVDTGTGAAWDTLERKWKDAE